jgi:hypothetical protein
MAVHFYCYRCRDYVSEAKIETHEHPSWLRRLARRYPRWWRLLP